MGKGKATQDELYKTLKGGGEGGTDRMGVQGLEADLTLIGAAS